MVSSEGDGHITLDKFGGDNFNRYKFKLEMVMSTKDLRHILDGLELPPPSTANNEVRNTFQWQCKKPSLLLSRAW